MGTTLRPLGDGVLVQLAPAKEKTEGGIIIPDVAKDRPVNGVVLAVGPGLWVDSASNVECLRPMGVKVGETVLFSKYAGTEVGPDLRILRESELLAVETPAIARPVPCEALDMSKAEDVPPAPFGE